MRAAAVLLALLIATAAGAQTPTPTAATRAFLAGFAAGNATTPIYTSGGTAPSVAWVSGASHWATRVNPADNAASYNQVAVSGSGDSNTLALAVRIPAAGFPASGENRLGEVRLSSTTMAILTIGSDRKVRAYFGDQARECTANSLYKFSTCTTDAECPVDTGGNPGESSCGAATFATSDAIAADTTAYLALVQEADSGGARPADVKLSLFRDGSTRGSKTRWQGACVGSTSGLLNSKACGATADCTALCAKVGGCSSGGTCTFSGVGAATAIRLGTTLTNAKAIDVNILEAKFVYSATDPSIRYSKIVPLWPTGDSTPNDWASVNTNCTPHSGCVDDTSAGGALDDDTFVLNDSTQNDVEIWTLTDYTPGAGEFPIAVAAWAHLKEQADNANTGKNVQFGLRDASTNETLSTTYDLASTTDGDLIYVTHAGPMTMTYPGGGAWNLNAMRGLIRFLKPAAGSGDRVRITNFVAEAEIGLAAPAPPGIFPDVNGNGRRTLCMVGDSIFNDPELYEALNGLAIDPDDILRCAVGGRKIGDIILNWSNILDGLATGDHPCIPERGDNYKCDVVVLHIGANNFGGTLIERTAAGKCYQRGLVGGSTPGAACTTNANGGTCTDRTGPQQGAACQIASGTEAQDGRYWITSSYCIDSSAIGTCCFGLGCTTSRCGGAGICSGGSVPKTLCTSDATCTGGGTCVQLATTFGGPQLAGSGANTLDDLTTGFGSCTRGDPTSRDCPLGVCVAQMETAYAATAFESLLATAAARTGTSAVKIVLAGNSEPCADMTGRKLCVGGASHGLTCTIDANCTGGACKLTHELDGWHQGIEMSRFLQQYLRARAANSGGAVKYIGLGQYLRRRAGRVTPDAMLRDCIHLNAEGQTAAAELTVACLTNDSAVPENECGTW